MPTRFEMLYRLTGLGSRRLILRTVQVVAVALLLATPRTGATQPSILDVNAGERLVVVAPHPDDETLGAGGLIQRVLARGGTVRVVLITAGDGYVEAVVHETGRLRPRPAEYVTYGERRLREARALERVVLTLTDNEVSAKRRALAQYASQQEVMASLLAAFVRRTEPFTVFTGTE